MLMQGVRAEEAPVCRARCRGQLAALPVRRVLDRRPAGEHPARRDVPQHACVSLWAFAAKVGAGGIAFEAGLGEPDVPIMAF